MSAQPSTNEESGTGARDQPPAKAITKKKRSIIGEHYYKEFSMEFWKEPGSQCSMTLSTLSTPSPLKTRSDTSSSPHKQTKSSRPVTPSTETPIVSRP
ncbi:9171_t:CDS:2, partial [Funneliformis mosseae]